MDDTKDELLRAAIRVCIEHGLDRPAFVELMRAGFDVGITRPEQTLSCHLTRFLFASLQWTVPPETADMNRRRKEAARSWACVEAARTRP